MYRTIDRLTGAAILGLSCALYWPSAAAAHALKAECRILGNNRVQVEAWFDNSIQGTHGADVRVFRPDGSLFAQGQLDERGRYVFSFDSPQRLQVMVSDGQGHVAKVWLTEENLAGDGSAPRAIRSAESPLKDLAAGLALLLAAAAFLLSWRNARRLRALEQRSGATSAPAKSPPTAPPTGPDQR